MASARPCAFDGAEQPIAVVAPPMSIDFTSEQCMKRGFMRCLDMTWAADGKHGLKTHRGQNSGTCAASSTVTCAVGGDELDEKRRPHPD